MAALSAVELNRTNSERVSASVVAAMSRMTPPAEMEPSWQSSPTRRMLAPRARAWVITASRSRVPAFPASSMMISGLGSDVAEPFGWR